MARSVYVLLYEPITPNQTWYDSNEFRLQILHVYYTVP
jgi:hypothetical protein